METRVRLPLGDIPQHPPIPLSEDIDSNWTPLEKAIETYGLTVMHCMSYMIQNDHDHLLDPHWDASKYNVGDPPDRTKIPIKSPFRPGLTEAKISEVIETTRKFLHVDPPEEYLKLLRITDGILGAGCYEGDSVDRRETEPFSTWIEVAGRMEDLMGDDLTEKGIPLEIQKMFDLAFSPSRVALICGFKCGLTTNSYGGSRGAYFVFVDDKDVESSPESEKIGKHWELMGVPITRDGCDRFDSIEALLRHWAEWYRYNELEE